MAITHVQGNLVFDNSGNTFSGLSLTLSSTVGNGHLIVGCISYQTQNALSFITDDQGNAYTIVDTYYSSSDVQSVSTFYACGISNGPRTISANFNPVSAYVMLAVDEFSGVSPRTQLDGHSMLFQTGIGTTANEISSGSITTTAIDDLIYAITNETTGSGAVAASGSGFTQEQQLTGSNLDTTTEYLVQSSPGSISGTFTASGGFATSGTAHFITGVMAFTQNNQSSQALILGTSNSPVVAKGPQKAFRAFSGTPPSYAVRWTANSAGSGTVNAGTGVSAVPGGTISAGDLLFAVVAVSMNTNVDPGTVTAPSGWKNLDNTYDGDQLVRTSVWYKVATASEPSNYGFGWTNASRGASWALIDYLGVSATSTVDVAVGQNNDTYTSSMTAPSTSAYNPNELLICVFTDLGGHAPYTVPAALTERIDVDSSSNYFPEILIADAQAPTNTISSNVATLTGTDPSRGLTVLLRPVIQGTGVPTSIGRFMDKLVYLAPSYAISLLKAISSSISGAITYKIGTLARSYKSLQRTFLAAADHTLSQQRTPSKLVFWPAVTVLSLSRAMSHLLPLVTQVIYEFEKTLVFGDITFPYLTESSVFSLETQKGHLLEVAEATVVSFGRFIGKLLLWTENTKLSFTKLITLGTNTFAALAESALVALPKTMSKPPFFTSGSSSAQANKTPGKPFSTSDIGIASSSRMPIKLLFNGEATVASFSHFLTKLLAVYEATMPILAKFLPVMLSASGETSTATVSTLLVQLLLLFISESSISQLTKMPGKLVLAVEPSSGALSRLISHIVGLTETSALSLVRLTDVVGTLTENTISLLAKMLARALWASDTSNSFLARTPIKLMSVAESSLTYFSRVIQKLTSISETTAISLTKSIPKLVDFAEASVVSFTKLLSKILPAMGFHDSTLAKMFQRTLAEVLETTSAVLSRTAVKLAMASETSLVSLSRLNSFLQALVYAAAVVPIVQKGLAHAMPVVGESMQAQSYRQPNKVLAALGRTATALMRFVGKLLGFSEASSGSTDLGRVRILIANVTNIASLGNLRPKLLAVAETTQAVFSLGYFRVLAWAETASVVLDKPILRTLLAYASEMPSLFKQAGVGTFGRSLLAISYYNIPMMLRSYGRALVVAETTVASVFRQLGRVLGITGSTAPTLPGPNPTRNVLMVLAISTAPVLWAYLASPEAVRLLGLIGQFKNYIADIQSTQSAKISHEVISDILALLAIKVGAVPFDGPLFEAEVMQEMARRYNDLISRNK